MSFSHNFRSPPSPSLFLSLALVALVHERDGEVPGQLHPDLGLVLRQHRPLPLGQRLVLHQLLNRFGPIPLLMFLKLYQIMPVNRNATLELHRYVK